MLSCKSYRRKAVLDSTIKAKLVSRLTISKEAEHVLFCIVGNAASNQDVWFVQPRVWEWCGHWSNRPDYPLHHPAGAVGGVILSSVSVERAFTPEESEHPLGEVGTFGICQY